MTVVVTMLVGPVTVIVVGTSTVVGTLTVEIDVTMLVGPVTFRVLTDVAVFVRVTCWPGVVTVLKNVEAGIVVTTPFLVTTLPLITCFLVIVRRPRDR